VFDTPAAVEASNVDMIIIQRIFLIIDPPKLNLSLLSIPGASKSYLNFTFTGTQTLIDRNDLKFEKKRIDT
jgi:hypothetical protein